MTSRGLAVLELRFQARHGVVGLVAGLATVWTVVLAVLPPPAARAAAPWLLLLETALLGTTLVGALVLLERDLGMRAALAVTPTRPVRRLATRVGLLALLVTGSAVPIAVAGRPTGPGGLALALLGVGLLAVLGMLVAVAVAANRQSVLTFGIALPLALLPLLLPALGHAAGLRHPLLYAVPTTGAVDLLQAGYTGTAAGPLTLAGSVGWLAIACLAAAGAALDRLGRGGGPARSSTPATDDLAGKPGDRWWAGGPVRAFLRTDLANIGRDPLLLLVAGSPLLLGLVLRLGYPATRDWLLDAHGFDLHPYRAPLLAVAIGLHVPVMFGMIGALLVLDDLDDRVLTALRTTPLTLPRYLAYRAGLITVAAWVGLAAAVPLSGLAAGPWQRLAAALVPAGLVAPLFMLATLSLARNKVEGVAAVKLLGLPAYAPVAAWWVTGPAGWSLAALPSWWVLQSLWTSGWYAVAATSVIGAATAVLFRRRSRAYASD